ncbi:MAG: hypothetical protein EZS28_012959 [Streblomastix strix]|uniref:Uncharacterized protein n=1 Tax=Streblomastix strix TaxID=222440 RepID=A0A5J4WA27_9EUKA|nr:MAG: hypothetical protein EZS28_012959 [Streblomastix strix]
MPSNILQKLDDLEICIAIKSFLENIQGLLLQPNGRAAYAKDFILNMTPRYSCRLGDTMMCKKASQMSKVVAQSFFPLVWLIPLLNPF